MYTEKDKINLQEIQDFLDSEGIEYSTARGNFCLFHDHPDGKRSYEIEYVPSHQVPIAYPKYGLAGVGMDHFYNLSYEAETLNNSFKCWVKDYEWRDDRKREVLKSYFMHAAGKSKHRFYARDCTVKEVPVQMARKFESENCFYGKRGASLSLGLFLNKDKNGLPAGTLMMIYTFGNNFFGKDSSIEILRVGTRKFSNVAGGASKLLKHFVRNYPVLRIGTTDVPVTLLKFYSDYDHNIGSSMDELGFKFVSYSKGGFMNYWVDTEEVKGRQPGQHKWVMEQLRAGKVLAIPNAGVKTFAMHIDRSALPPPDEPKIPAPDILF